MPDLTIDDETFLVELEGPSDRPTLLLSNSLGTDLTLWDAQMQPFLEHFRVVRYDARGHGRSTGGGDPCSIARLGKDALAILDALGIGSVHFVGISMGGAVGQWLLVNAPGRIERAVLANTAARFGTPDLWNTRIDAVRAKGIDSLAAATMERWFGAAYRARAADRVAAIEARFRATSPDGYAACCAALRDMDMREALRAVEQPVLIVTGVDDPVVGPADVAAMIDAIGGAKHVALACRHLSNVEAETAFNAAVLSFLTAKTPKTAKTAARAARTRSPPKSVAVASTRRPATGRAAAARSPLKAQAVKPVAPKRAAPQPTAAPSARRRAAAVSPPSSTAKREPRKAARTPVLKSAPRKAVAKPTAKAPQARRTAVGRTRITPKPIAAKAKLAKPAVGAAAKKAASKKATPKKQSARRRPTKKAGRPVGRRKR